MKTCIVWMETMCVLIRSSLIYNSRKQHKEFLATPLKKLLEGKKLRNRRQEKVAMSAVSDTNEENEGQLVTMRGRCWRMLHQQQCSEARGLYNHDQIPFTQTTLPKRQPPIADTQNQFHISADLCVWIVIPSPVTIRCFVFPYPRPE